jgi:hypothetical protein
VYPDGRVTFSKPGGALSRRGEDTDLQICIGRANAGINVERVNDESYFATFAIVLYFQIVKIL